MPSYYTEEIKARVAEYYPLCQTREDRLELARELGIDSLAKLYNLGSRVGALREQSLGAPQPLVLPQPAAELPHDVYADILAAARGLALPRPQPVVEPQPERAADASELDVA